jgi:hypothetical protein
MVPVTEVQGVGMQGFFTCYTCYLSTRLHSFMEVSTEKRRSPDDYESFPRKSIEYRNLQLGVFLGGWTPNPANTGDFLFFASITVQLNSRTQNRATQNFYPYTPNSKDQTNQPNQHINQHERPFNHHGIQG